MSELLMYIQYFRNCASRSKLQGVVVRFYTDDEIASAKTLLLDSFVLQLAESEFAIDCRSSVIRLAKAAETDDIINMFAVLDRLNVLSAVRFVAVSYDRLPSYGPEELNVSAVVDKQIRTEQRIDNMTVKIDKTGTTAFSTYTC